MDAPVAVQTAIFTAPALLGLTVFLKVGGVWKPAQVKVKVGGVWKDAVAKNQGRRDMEMNGIDISQWQGDMDLTPYKDGFVIIRGGFWTSADPWAERNIAKCEKLGIPWGLYWYSYALSEAQARQEAEACLEFLAGRKPRLGVWFDMEDADAYKAKNGFPLDETITAMCKSVLRGYGRGREQNRRVRQLELV